MLTTKWSGGPKYSAVVMAWRLSVVGLSRLVIMLKRTLLCSPASCRRRRNTGVVADNLRGGVGDAEGEEVLRGVDDVLRGGETLFVGGDCLNGPGECRGAVADGEIWSHVEATSCLCAGAIRSVFCIRWRFIELNARRNSESSTSKERSEIFTKP